MIMLLYNILYQQILVHLLLIESIASKKAALVRLVAAIPPAKEPPNEPDPVAGNEPE
jgi:hypothetical protein